MKQDSNDTPRPSSYNEAVDHYLYTLRERAVTNMFGATPYLKRDFGMTQEEAHACLLFWMRSFSRESAQAVKESLSSGSKKRRSS